MSLLALVEKEDEEQEVIVAIEMVVVAMKNKREGERQRGTTKEENHVILLWYTSSLVPGSDVLLTRHTLQLASLQDLEEWVYPTVPIAVSCIYRVLCRVWPVPT